VSLIIYTISCVHYARNPCRNRSPPNCSVASWGTYHAATTKGAFITCLRLFQYMFVNFRSFLYPSCLLWNRTERKENLGKHESCDNDETGIVGSTHFPSRPHPRPRPLSLTTPQQLPFWDQAENDQIARCWSSNCAMMYCPLATATCDGVR
jgi:hypothetical protein